MGNLFATFDPVTLKPYLFFNWVSILLIALLPSPYWLMKSHFFWSLDLSFKALSAELKLVLGGWGSPRLILISMFFLILMNNLAGLLPYVFTSTAHLSVTVALALPLWSGYFLVNFLKNPSVALAHLVPEGTPAYLISFMVLVELVSTFIRPITLAVRLTANMMAGHLLLSLLSSPVVISGWPIASMILGAIVALTCLELAVSIIQAYVFTTLSSLYLAEVNNINN